MPSVSQSVAIDDHGGCRRQRPTVIGQIRLLFLAAFIGQVPYGRRREDRLAFLVRWHDSELLFLSLAVLILSMVDAILTLNILGLGGAELNPLMAYLIDADLGLFIMAKMSLTGMGLVVLVAQARFCLFKHWPVEWLLRALLPTYLGLVCYEVMLIARALA